MSKEEFLKIQTCVLKVNIHCDGCKHKVKKLLQKIDGVYTTSIDAEQGKVTVSGNVDPATLIKKLAKSGKHAELWGQPKANQLNAQFQKLLLDNSKNPKDAKSQNQKGTPKDPKGSPQRLQQQLLQQHHQLLQQQQQMAKGLKDMKFLPQFKDMKLPGKEPPKSVKFALPEDEDSCYDDEDDEFDDYDDDEFDDMDDDEIDELQKMPPMKQQPNKIARVDAKVGAQMMGNLNQNNAKKEGDNRKKGGAGEATNPQIKGGNGDGKMGNGGGEKGGGNHPEPGSGGKSVGFIDVKPTHGGGGGDGIAKNNMPNGGNNGGKKSGKNAGGNHPMGGNGGFHNIPVTAGSGGHPGGMVMRNMVGIGGQPTAFTASNGVPAAMHAGGMFQGATPESLSGNPYYQQYLAMMNNRQQVAAANERYLQMAYSRPPAPAFTFQPPPSESAEYATHFFSDENANSCSVM